MTPSTNSVLQGTRLPDAVFGEPGPGWDAWNKGRAAAGSYMRVNYDGKDELYIVDPNGRIGRCSTHSLTWHDDGTVTVAPSIYDTSPGGWHGWLEHGGWRSV